MAPGGSYLYELRRWADAVRELNSECAARRGDVCLNLLAYLRNFPETDQDATGGHGVLGPGSDVDHDRIFDSSKGPLVILLCLALRLLFMYPSLVLSCPVICA
ncbi:Kcnh5 [Symbiodinium sp. CCMP2592]|nr:Kcnh5 [Symbiodinium sp. CCMP2592]